MYVTEQAVPIQLTLHAEDAQEAVAAAVSAAAGGREGGGRARARLLDAAVAIEPSSW